MCSAVLLMRGDICIVILALPFSLLQICVFVVVAVVGYIGSSFPRCVGMFSRRFLPETGSFVRDGWLSSWLVDDRPMLFGGVIYLI